MPGRSPLPKRRFLTPKRPRGRTGAGFLFRTEEFCLKAPRILGKPKKKKSDGERWRGGAPSWRHGAGPRGRPAVIYGAEEAALGPWERGKKPKGGGSGQTAMATAPSRGDHPKIGAGRAVEIAFFCPFFGAAAWPVPQAGVTARCSWKTNGTGVE